MAKERKIAVDMWEYVRDEIPRKPNSSIYWLKKCFLSQYGIDWNNGCWFCHYIRHECNRCPLGSCLGSGSPWKRVVFSKNIEDKQKACDKIISALKGEWKNAQE